ncbi:MAG: hypothetical protein HC843_04360 [Sphingomonadales bacterium]|nr:hypothetical protein [Sphingomonadales bacterium]
MKLAQALTLMESQNKSMRRKGWHNGIRFVQIDGSKGFTEPFVYLAKNNLIINYPYAPQRADWCTDDWYEVSPEELTILHNETEEKPEAPKVAQNPKTQRKQPAKRKARSKAISRTRSKTQPQESHN